MPCFNPITAYRTEAGDVCFTELKGSVETLTLPCGRCEGCLLERSRQWAIRCMHEASLYPENCFLTLTYSESQLPPGGSLRYRDFQLFMKRLRQENRKRLIRFFMCGEYGELYRRPHFHACVFNYDFPDRVYFRTSGSGEKLFTSETLSRLWPHGFATIGDVTFESAAYAARYVLKKEFGKGAKSSDVVDPDTGVITSRTPEFCHMSLRPGIGAPWLAKFFSDVYPNGDMVVNGSVCKPPRYYDKLFRRLGASDLAAARALEAYKKREDNTAARLEVKRAVLKARLSLRKRSLEAS